MQAASVVRLGRLLYMLGTVGTLFVGIGTQTAPLIAFGALLFVGFFPFSRWLADRSDRVQTDERTDRLMLRAGSRAIVVLYVAAMVVWFAGAVLAVLGSLSGPLEALYTQARTVAVWTATALITSVLAHQLQERRRLHRLEA